MCVCTTMRITSTDLNGSEYKVADASYRTEKKETEIEKLEDEDKNSTRSARLTKAKEKYMKLHEQLLKRDLELKRIRDLESLASESDCGGRKRIARKIIEKYEKWQETKIYKILFCTAQPAHVITIAAVLCVASALVPSSERVLIPGQPRSRTASFIYLASFVMHFGAQIWMTFISGLSLYFALPRHAFGEVQRVLFPRYFTLNACLSLTTLLIFVKHHPIHTWDTEIAIQVIGMSSAFFLQLIIRLYLTPPLLNLMLRKISLERTAGVGEEIGRHDPGPLKHCPYYLRIHGTFRRIHVTIAMGNMLALACTVFHLYYIASKLCAL